MKIPLHLLILAALCFGLCACGRTGIPAHTTDSEVLTFCLRRTDGRSHEPHRSIAWQCPPNRKF